MPRRTRAGHPAFRSLYLAVPLAAVGLFMARPALAGVTNPDISVIGQPFLFFTDDPSNPDRKRVRPDIGETEVVFDAALNPYARGFFTLSIGEEGLDLEEGYFSLNRGLPLDLALKGGQYRVGFGRLNPTHPHAYPFAEPFGVLHNYLPGDEADIDVGASLSRRFPIAGDLSVDVAADWLQGDVFRIDRTPVDAGDPLTAGGDDDVTLTRAGWAGRISAFDMVGDQSAIEFGVSATGGTNNVAAGAKTTVFGADAKVKLWTSPASNLVLQGELLHLERDDAGWNAVDGYTTTRVDPTGGYLYGDYYFSRRVNAGASFEHFQQPTTAKDWESSVGGWVGLSLMEETTSFRLDWRRHLLPEDGADFNDIHLRVIFSMGPHKAHQF